MKGGICRKAASWKKLEEPGEALEQIFFGNSGSNPGVILPATLAPISTPRRPWVMSKDFFFSVTVREASSGLLWRSGCC